jgi:hypothetical protein
MDAEGTDPLRLAVPPRVSDDPRVSGATQRLVDAVALEARHLPRRAEGAGRTVRFVIAAAACIIAGFLFTQQPSGTGNFTAGLDRWPGVGNASPDSSLGGEAPASAASPESAGSADCVVISRIVTDDDSGKRPTGEDLRAARAFLRDTGLRSVPLDMLSVPTPLGPQGLAAAEVENRSVAEIEASLADAGHLRPGIAVQSTVICADRGAP